MWSIYLLLVTTVGMVAAGIALISLGVHTALAGLALSVTGVGFFLLFIRSLRPILGEFREERSHNHS